MRRVLGGVFGVLLVGTAALSQPVPPAAEKPRPRLVPVAETRLVMEAVTAANHKGVEKLLKERPADAETWAYVRGQSLLIAESGNLLMLRPPKNAGQEAWMGHATELRDNATLLAREAGNRDYERSRQALGLLTATCNRCHQTFRVPHKVELGR